MDETKKNYIALGIIIIALAVALYFAVRNEQTEHKLHAQADSDLIALRKQMEGMEPIHACPLPQTIVQEVPVYIPAPPPACPEVKPVECPQVPAAAPVTNGLVNEPMPSLKLDTAPSIKTAPKAIMDIKPPVVWRDSDGNPWKDTDGNTIKTGD